MDPRIAQSTTFQGRRLTRRQIADIQTTPALFPNHSRNELAKTPCEHLDWRSAKGDYKVSACLTMLQTLQAHGIATLHRSANRCSASDTNRLGPGRPSPTRSPHRCRRSPAPAHLHRDRRHEGRRASVECLRRPPSLSRPQNDHGRRAASTPQHEESGAFRPKRELCTTIPKPITKHSWSDETRRAGSACFSTMV